MYCFVEGEFVCVRGVNPFEGVRPFEVDAALEKLAEIEVHAEFEVGVGVVDCGDVERVDGFETDGVMDCIKAGQGRVFIRTYCDAGKFPETAKKAICRAPGQ